MRLYGIHTVRAALDNPRRKITRLMVTRNALSRLELAEPLDLPYPAEIVEPREIEWFMERTPDKSHGGSTAFAPPPKSCS